ncbi:Gcd10p family-domain-containing protein [Blastocladiella britannica]|nr:Gcd10p family-domain-containing protein [Blastocladiella britannica]
MEADTAPAAAPAVVVAPPVRVPNSSRIQNGDSVLIVMPSDNKKIVVIEAGQEINLGKFGRFYADELIDRHFDVTYDLSSKGELTRGTQTEAAFDLPQVEVPENNNQDIYDDNSNQKLTNVEIDALKSEGKQGKELIDAIISGHADFDKKTEFSKAKYIKKKREKFLRQFTPVRIDAATLCQFYFEKTPWKTRELRLDVLALLLTSANIRAHARVLVFDDTAGMLTAAILERMGGTGEVVVVHEAQSQNLEALKHMNFGEDVLATVKSVPFHRAFPLPDEMEIWEETADKIELRNKPSFRELRELVLAGGFDSLVISTDIDPLSVVKLLEPLLLPSRPLVVHHPAANLLLPVQQHLRSQSAYLMVDLVSTWYRPYQVLPQRTHPEMNMSGQGGALVVATKVEHGILPNTMNKADIANISNAKKQRPSVGKKRSAAEVAADDSASPPITVKKELGPDPKRPRTTSMSSTTN